MPDLIVCNSLELTNQAIKLVQKTIPNNNTPQYLVIAVNDEVSKKLTSNNIQHKKLIGYSPDLKRISERGIDWLKAWHKIPLKGNKNVKELFTHEGASLWWFMDVWFYYSSFLFNPTLKEIFNHIEIAQKIIETEKPQQVIIFDETELGEAIKNVCTSKNVHSTIIRRNVFLRSKQVLIKHLTLKTPQSKLFLKLSRMFIRQIYWTFLKISYKRHSSLYTSNEDLEDKKKILIFSADYCVPVRNLDTLAIKKGEPYLYSVIDELEKNPRNLMAFVGILRGYSAGLAVMKKQLQENQLIYRPFDSYMTLGMIIRTTIYHIKLRRTLKTVTATPEFAQSLNYFGVPLSQLTKSRLSFLFGRFSFDSILQIEMARRIVQTEKPSIIVITEETVNDGRAIIIAAKEKGIPILCVQHGITGSPGITDYDHNTDDFGPNQEVAAPFCPIPDKIALYGNFYKQACIRLSKYPESILSVTGSPRYDILAFADKIFKQNDIFDELSRECECNFDGNKKTILLLTQPLPSIEERELILRYAYSAIKKLNDVQLIVKLHPGEINFFLHKKLLKEYGLENAVIVKNFDTNKLLYVSDLVIAALSTTLLEAIALNKQVILLDFFNRGYSDFLQSKGALPEVKTEEELYHAIMLILFNSKHNELFYQNQRDFTFEHLFKNDGKASKRVADLINEIIA